MILYDSSGTVSIPQTQADKLAAGQNAISSTYIAPYRNRHIFGVLPQDGDQTFYFSPNYVYGTDDIPQYQQVVIEGGSGGQGEDNQNAFSNIIVENTTVSATSTTDNVQFVKGDNIQITADADEKTITFSTNYYWDDIDS